MGVLSVAFSKVKGSRLASAEKRQQDREALQDAMDMIAPLIQSLRELEKMPGSTFKFKLVTTTHDATLRTNIRLDDKSELFIRASGGEHRKIDVIGDRLLATGQKEFISTVRPKEVADFVWRKALEKGMLAPGSKKPSGRGPQSR